MNERIKKLRKVLDLTQQEFARKIGSVQNTITGYETGRRIPSNQVISLISKEFNVNENWLRNGVEPMFMEVSKDEQISHFVNNILSQEPSSFKRRFISLLSRLSDHGWEVLERMVLELAEGHTTSIDMEIAEEPAPEIAFSRKFPPVITNEGKESREDIERQADEFAATARQQFILEKKRGSKVSIVKESEVG